MGDQQPCMPGQWLGLLLALPACIVLGQGAAAGQRPRRALGSEDSPTASRASVCKSFCRSTGFQGSLGDCSCGYIIFNGKRKRSASWDNPPGCESFCISTGWKQRIGTCNCGTYVIAMKRAQLHKRALSPPRGEAVDEGEEAVAGMVDVVPIWLSQNEF